ncbi:MAG: ABC transporter ATP-binding protein [Acidimicrobiales bacterium]|nr:ABC transporter ATP-binding protein [Acidimicrobiales bacterium]
MSLVVEAVNLVKAYGATRALDGLNLEVQPGQVHGFLGPNGSGKSTTLKVLLGLARSDSGTVKVFGGDPWADSVELHRRLAYVPGEVSLWPNLSGGEIINLMCALRSGVDKKRLDDLIERFHLDVTRKARTYSKGNRQKVALVAALAADVELLLLDEPTAGLDPLMESEFRLCISEARERGQTVLLSSHILSEVEATCDQVTIIRGGKAVESGRLSELSHLGQHTLRAELLGPASENIASMAGVSEVVADANMLTCSYEPGALNELLQEVARIGVVSLQTRPPTLEELFLRHYMEPESGGR